MNIAEGISILVRLYRKSDRHLVSESRARGVLQLYQIALEGLALPHEAAPVSAPDTPSKTRKAPSKKAGDIKSALGKKSAQGDEVEFILECSLDETAMIVPPHWHSRVPFSFCIDAADASTANSQPMCRKGKDGLEEKLPQAVLPSLPSMCPSASLPQFQWQVDVLAGTVGDVSHDTYDLERQVEWKNGWEEASQGRAERAAAAMAYVLEKKVQRAALLLAVEPEPEPQMIPIGGGKVTAATPSPLSTDRLVDLLALALEREEQRPLLAERETRLLGLQEVRTVRVATVVSCPFVSCIFYFELTHFKLLNELSDVCYSFQIQFNYVTVQGAYRGLARHRPIPHRALCPGGAEGAEGRAHGDLGGRLTPHVRHDARPERDAEERGSQQSAESRSASSDRTGLDSAAVGGQGGV